MFSFASVVVADSVASVVAGEGAPVAASDVPVDASPSVSFAFSSAAVACNLLFSSAAAAVSAAAAATASWWASMVARSCRISAMMRDSNGIRRTLASCPLALSASSDIISA